MPLALGAYRDRTFAYGSWVAMYYVGLRGGPLNWAFPSLPCSLLQSRAATHVNPVAITVLFVTAAGTVVFLPSPRFLIGNCI